MKMKQLFYQRPLISLVRIEASDRLFQSTGSPIEDRSSPGLMTCLGASDDTSIFIQTREALNIKDQTGRSVHKEVGPNK
jgi:hypothetical protein